MDVVWLRVTGGQYFEILYITEMINTGETISLSAHGL